MVERRRLDIVPADIARATSFLRQAEERLNQLPLLTNVVVKYGGAAATGRAEQVARTLFDAALARGLAP